MRAIHWDQTKGTMPQVLGPDPGIHSDMKKYDKTDYFCEKCYSQLWKLRRLNGLGVSETEMMVVHTKQVWSILELGVPVWHPALTNIEVKQIECVQRCGLHIILGEHFTTYDQSMNLLEFPSLNERRFQL
jgi:hypothetical protein